jgi:hypothetical protein
MSSHRSSSSVSYQQHQHSPQHFDVANRGFITLDELEVPREQSTSGDTIGSMDVSRNRLTSFALTNESLRRALGGVEQLLATNNRFSSFEGLDRWAPRLQVLDASHNTVPLGVIATPDQGTDDIDEGLSISTQGIANGAVLARLAHLTSLRLDSCGLDLVRLHPLDLAPSSSPSFSFLQELYLAHNQLTALPHLLECKRLEILDLSYNAIQHLEDISERLPAGVIQELSLVNNSLSGGLLTLVPLSYLAESLLELSIADGNDACWAHRGSPPQWSRGLIAFLCPNVLHVDSLIVSSHDRQFAAALFRNEGHSELDEGLLALLEERREVQLMAYLRNISREFRTESLSPQRAPHPLPNGSHAAATSRRHNATSSLGDADRSGSSALLTTDVQRVGGGSGGASKHSNSTNAASVTVSGAAPRHVSSDVATGTRVATGGASMVVSGGRFRTLGEHYTTRSRPDAPVEDIVGAIQQKLFLMEQAVTQLWHSDQMRQHWSAVRIQSVFRGYRVRQRLPRSSRQRLRLVHARMLRTRTKPWLAEESISAQTTAVTIALANAPLQSSTTSSPLVGGRPSPSGGPSDAESSHTAIQQRVQGMDKILRKLWGDVKVMKHFIATQHNRAALCIQRHYRAHRARCVWKRLKQDFEEFQRGFLPPVRTLQEVGRRFMARRKIIFGLQLERENRRLRDDVVWLKESVKGLQHTVQLLLRERRVASLSSVPVAPSNIAVE